MSLDNESIKSSEYESCTTIRCFDSEMQLIFDGANCYGRNMVNKKDNSLENIKLSDLVNQFEDILVKVKDLELYHLIEPIEATSRKLRKLEEASDQLTFDSDEDFSRVNKTCCNEIDLKNKKLFNTTGIDLFCSQKPNKLDNSLCRCPNDCHCASTNDSDNDNLRKTTTYCISPCKCVTDNKIKIDTLKPTAINYNKGNDKIGNSEISGNKGKTKDAKIFARKLNDDDGDIIVESTIDNSRIEIQTNLKDMSLGVNKEKTTIRDTAFVRVNEKSQGILCDLSSETSTDEYDSESSSEYNPYDLAPPKGRPLDYMVSSKARDELKEQLKKRQQGNCGCDDQQASPCPCGCGDATIDLSRKDNLPSLECHCENCGKEICRKAIPTRIQDNQLRVDEIRRNYEKSINDQKQQPRDSKHIHYTDIKSYVEDLEVKCLEKDKIINQLTEEIKHQQTSLDERRSHPDSLAYLF